MPSNEELEQVVWLLVSAVHWLDGYIEGMMLMRDDKEDWETPTHVQSAIEVTNEVMLYARQD